MSHRMINLLKLSFLGLALTLLVGCGGSAETEPPESDAVTTDPLDIELPADTGSDAAEAPTDEGEEAPETDEGDAAEAP